MLELAVLGLLHEAPMHGYELRKRLSTARGVPGVLVRFAVPAPAPADCGAGLDRRGAAGRPDRGHAGRGGPGASTGSPPRARSGFAELLADAGPQTWDDDGFGVHLAFFSRTPAETRMRILEGRRRAGRGTPGGAARRAGPRRRADRPLHPRAAPAGAGDQRARGALAQRTDRPANRRRTHRHDRDRTHDREPGTNHDRQNRAQATARSVGSPSSASATAPRPSSRASSTTRRRPGHPGTRPDARAVR